MAHDAPAVQLRPYNREEVARFLEEINEQIGRNPERHQLTAEERAEWAAFPAQARAHPFSTVMLNPYRPVADYMRSGRIGPDYSPEKHWEAICK